MNSQLDKLYEILCSTILQSIICLRSAQDDGGSPDAHDDKVTIAQKRLECLYQMRSDFEKMLLN